MANNNTPSNKIVHWFKNLVRPVFQQTEPQPVLGELDKYASVIEALEQNQGALFPICLLGQAGVGKSTLINTLIADTDIVVPSGGGTGPLTASALRVMYGERPIFDVRYHSPKQVNDIRNTLELKLHSKTKIDTAPTQDIAIEDEDISDISLDSNEQKSRTEEAIGKACLLVSGTQSHKRELPYLVDALRWVLGQSSQFQTQLLEEDLQRLRGVQEALQYGLDETSRYFDSASDPDFRQRLRDHACGFLAPLIQEMSIHWPSPLLRDSLEIVDLPGIGILSDAYASVTSDYLRNRAKAVMLVADSRGLKIEDAELLRTSGFLSRLLHASDDPTSDPVALIVAVVKIDDVAVENWKNDKAVNGTPLKSKPEHFADQVKRCRDDVAKRLDTFLREVWQDDTQGKRDVIQSILDNLQVFPVSAPEYRLLVTTDPDENKPFLRDVDATNIPALRMAISQIAKRCIAERNQHYQETQQLFLGQLRARLDVLDAQRNAEKQAEEEIQRLTDGLGGFLAPLQREFDTRRGGFRNFLRKTIPAQIEAKVDVASIQARKEITSYMRTLRGAHWRTLQAAVRREGTFYGSRHINLPHDFALRFEEPVAEVWSREILVSVRKETREFADYQSAATTQILDWARGQGIRGSTRLLEALIEDINQHRQQVNAVGKDAVNDLRDKVRSELIKDIEGPIRRKCKKFVEDQQDSGSGVKLRIVELFEQLAEDVVAAAAAPATNLLIQRFKEVDKEILAAFREHSDPLNEAADALIQRKEKQLTAGEDANSRALSSAIESALAARPEVEFVNMQGVLA